jgi:transcriptional regulator with XRE-family HTH domain
VKAAQALVQVTEGELDLLVQALRVFRDHVNARGRARVAARVTGLLGKLDANEPVPVRPARQVTGGRRPPAPTSFATRLRELRMQRGWTQEQLAEKVGTSKCAVGHWEQGVREPNWSKVVALALALDVSTEALRQAPQEPTTARCRGRPRHQAAPNQLPRLDIAVQSSA